MKMEDPKKPDLGTSEELIEESGLHLVLCGGLSVGLYTQPKAWLLRPKNEVQVQEQRTKDLQRLAGAMRYLSQCMPYVPKELSESIDAFIKKI